MSSLQRSRTWSETASLSQILKAESLLNGDKSEKKTTNPSGFVDILLTRLRKFDELIDGTERYRDLDLENLKIDTAFASLYVLECVHNILSEHDTNTSAAPLIGTKDMAQLRTTLSVVYGWGTELLLKRILGSLPNKSPPRVPPGAQIIDLTSTHENYELLLNIINRLLVIVFPDEGSQSKTTFVTASILSRDFSNLLRSCICLAWLPKGVDNGVPNAGSLKPYVERLLSRVPPSLAIASLGQILSKPGTMPKYAAKTCSTLLSLQLQRPAGVAGLLSATFGEDPTETDAPLAKLESVAKIMNVPPNNIPHEIYYAMIMPRLMYLLSPSMEKKTPPTHKRAAAFALSRMILASLEAEDPTVDIRQLIINWSLLDAFRTQDRKIVLPQSDIHEKMERAHEIVLTSGSFLPTSAILTLSTILTNTDPSPELISTLVQPIVPRLYSLYEHLQNSKAVDPVLLETIEGLLSTWARAATRSESVEILWEIIDGEAWDWDVGEDGDLCITQRTSELPSLTLSQLADLQEGKIDDEEEENTLGMKPDPLKFAQFLKKIERDDVSSAIYLKTIDAQVKSDTTDNPFRKLKLLKLSMQISTHVDKSIPEDSPLKKPDVMRMLMFIKLSLDQDKTIKKASTNQKLSLESLRLVSDDDEDDDEGDSDDEDLAPGLEGIDRREHLSVTAINLLLALLQENSGLSPRTVPLLNEIYSYLEPLANSDSDALRPRAREARLVLTARIASNTPTKASKPTDEEEKPQEKYQRALNLLQDPLLPVRAHGLLLLRELVSPAKRISGRSQEKPGNLHSGAKHGAVMTVAQGAQVAPPSVDQTLVPSILSIFLQSIQDEDSYIFLNSVQGLAAMVDGFGKEVLRGLISEYAKGPSGTNNSSETMPVRELDMRIRVGEALGQVIRRCGSALGNYVDILVPPIFSIVRGVHFPTTLRTSAVSLLATAVDTYILALNMYAADLLTAMVDLIQVESVAAQSKAKLENKGTDTENEAGASSSESNRKVTKVGEKISNGKQDTKGKQVESANGLKDRASLDNENIKDKEDIYHNTMDSEPTSSNPKFPPLRRAALHLLSLFARAMTKQIYDHNGVPIDISGLVLRRGKTTMEYISVTDVDDVVRVMARETGEQLEQLQKALVGL